MLEDLGPPSEVTDASSEDLVGGARATIKEKWQGAVTEGSGFVAVPMALLRLQAKYGLNATDMLVLINLLSHWWEPHSTVFPRSTTIAARMDVDKRTVQRATQKLQRKGLLRKGTTEDGKRSYDFTPLVARLAKDVTLAYSVQAAETHGDD